MFYENVLRLIHNRFGYWFKNGITQTQYNKGVLLLAHILKRMKYPGQTITQLVTDIGNKYPYVPQLSQDDWNKFKNEDFNPLSYELSGIITDLKDEMKTITDWDLSDIPDIN